jgi:N-hydroxyarylamine O-acetyltransferase
MGEEWVLQASVHQEWRSLYQFSLQEQLLPDYQVSNWYLCHHPDSHFTKGLIAARVTPEGRYGLRNNQLTLHDRQGNTQRHVLETATQLRSTLENVFGLTLPQVPSLDPALEKISTLPINWNLFKLEF